MRRAKIVDNWEDIRISNEREIRRIELVWRDTPRLGSGRVEFTRPVTLVCGENGAGKSTLLHLLHQGVAALSEFAVISQFSRPHNGKVKSLSVELKGQEATKSRAKLRRFFFPGGEAARVTFVDTGMEVPRLLQQFRDDPHFAEYLEGVQPRVFSSDELAKVSFILGRDYEELLVYEVADASSDDPVPYFVARSHGVQYASPEMGYGEVAALFMIWVLSTIPKGSLLLIEEPEAFLSPRAQTAFTDVMADYGLRRNLMIVLTSHSGAVAKRLDLSEVTFVSRAAGVVVLERPARMSALVERLGLFPGPSPVLYVEDKAGAVFAKSLINRYSHRLAGQCEVVPMGGEGNVKKLIKTVGGPFESVVHIGILDGDQRRGVPSEGILFLPGDLPPDALLRAYAIGLSIQQLARCLGSTVPQTRAALAAAEGSDTHDWPGELGAVLGQEVGEILGRLASAWAEQFGDDARAFVDALETMYRKRTA